MYRWRGLGVAPSASVSTALANASAQTGVPLSLLTQVAQTESSYNPFAVSPAGAQGLMQLMPSTAASLGVSNPMDPNQSALGGAQYLESLYKQYGDWETALEAYNEGPGNLQANLVAGVAPVSEDYATSILSAAGMDSSSPDLTVTAADSGIDLTSLLSSDGSANWTLIGLAAAGALALLWAVR